VFSATSTRLACHRFAAARSVGAAVGSVGALMSGTRSAASSPAIQPARIVASRLVVNEPPYRIRASRPPNRNSTR
jgi:hypothetical protein